MNAKEQYTAAYRALRTRERELKESVWTRFTIMRKHFVATNDIKTRFIIAADKAYRARNNPFNGYVCFNWYPDLLNHARYGAYLPLGYAMRMIPSYARFNKS